MYSWKEKKHNFNISSETLNN